MYTCISGFTFSQGMAQPQPAGHLQYAGALGVAVGIAAQSLAAALKPSTPPQSPIWHNPRPLRRRCTRAPTSVRRRARRHLDGPRLAQVQARAAAGEGRWPQRVTLAAVDDVEGGRLCRGGGEEGDGVTARRRTEGDLARDDAMVDYLLTVHGSARTVSLLLTSKFKPRCVCAFVFGIQKCCSSHSAVR
jgi:hypothetical protein